LFDDFDVLVAAGSDSTAQPLVERPRPRRRSAPVREEQVNQKEPDGISSLCGLPALCVPCGFSKENLPYGLQFLVRATNDRAVVAAATRYQSLTDWHQRHPQIF
jgi:Asp-tRNA(Asn)/Glu-tRNA(Gln) amidotransferase A subunit family amidase